MAIKKHRACCAFHMESPRSAWLSDAFPARSLASLAEGGADVAFMPSLGQLCRTRTCCRALSPELVRRLDSLRTRKLKLQALKGTPWSMGLLFLTRAPSREVRIRVPTFFFSFFFFFFFFSSVVYFSRGPSPKKGVGPS